MAEIAKGIIDVEINTGQFSAELKSLQAQINAFNLTLNKNSKVQGTFAREYAKELQDAINRTGTFTAETIRLNTAAATLDKTLSKGRVTLGQFFSARFNKDSAIAAETMALAAERARRLQTQFVATSAAANGMQDALAIRPLAAFSSELAIASERSQILSAMFKQGTTQLINFGKNVQWAGRQLMVGFTVPLTIFGTTAGKTFMELEKQVVAFKKVYGDLFTTPTELNQNLEAVKGLAAEYTKYGIAAKDTIGLAAQAAAAGRKNADLTDAVAQATRLATLGQMDQNSALETTISLQSAFRLSGQDLADTINFLNMVENQTVVSLQDLAAAIPRVAPVVQGLGGDVKDLSVFLAAMQEGGVDAAEGANALKSGLASLINPTKQATQMLAGMGINLDAIIKANKGDLMGTVLAFSNALAALDQFSRQQALEQVFGKFQYAKLGALFDNITRQGSQAQQVIATMGYTTEQLGATADKELSAIENSIGVQLTGAVERFKLAIAPIGEIFAKTAIPIINFLTGIIEKFNGLSDGKKQFIAIATAIVGIVIPAATMLLGLLMNLSGTLLKMFQGLGAFSKGLITGGPLGAIRALTQSSKYLSLAEIDAAMAAQQLAVSTDAVNAALMEQAASAGLASAGIDKLINSYRSMIATQANVSGLPAFGVAASAAKGIRTGGAGFRVQRRNSGGPIFMSNGSMVPGVGNTDRVPAMLTPGEFVVNKKAASQNFGLLSAINGSSGSNNISANGVQNFLFGGGVLRLLASMFGRRGMARPVARPMIPSQGASVIAQEMSDAQQIASLRSANAFRNVSNQSGPSVKSGNTKSNFVYRFSNSDNQSLKTGVEDTDGFVRRMLSNDSIATIDAYAQESGTIFDKFAYRKAIFRKHQQLKKMYAPQKIRYIDTLDSEDALKAIEKNPDVKFIPLNELHTDAIKKLDKRHIDALFRHETTVVPEYRKPSVTSGSQRGKKFIAGLYKEGQKLPGKGEKVQFTSSKNYTGPVRELEPGDKVLYKDSGKIFEWNGSEWFDTGQVAGIRPSDKGRAYKDITEKYYPPLPKTQYSHVVGIENLPKFNSGSIVPGSGNKDTIPAMLTPGEFVVNKDATRKNLDLLKQINNGQVSGYNEGGGVWNKVRSGSMMASMAGFGLMGVGQFSSNQTIQKTSMAAGTALSMLPILTSLPAPLAALAAGVTLVGAGMYKLNKSVNEAVNAGAKLSEAMYGTAESTRSIAEAFGRQTLAQASLVSAASAAGGTQITQQAQQVSNQFLQTDAGKKMLQDISLVEARGKSASQALTNQLSQAIIAGAITTDEARAIAVEIGTALKNESIAVDVSANITRLMGPNGENITKNILEIQAEISPVVDISALEKEAQTQYNNMNVFQKAWSNLVDGSFTQQYKLQEITKSNNALMSAQLNTVEYLNAALRDGAISWEEYNKKISESKLSTQSALSTNAKALGANSQAELVRMAEEARAQGGTGKKTWIDFNPFDTGQFYSAQIAAIDEQKNQVRKMLEDSGSYSKEAVDQIISDFEKIGDTSWGKILTGEWTPTQNDILLNFQMQGLSAEQIDSTMTKLNALKSVEGIELAVDIKGLQQSSEGIERLYNNYTEFSKLSDVEKKAKFETDNAQIVLDKLGASYSDLSNLSDIQKTVFIRYIDQYITLGQSKTLAAQTAGGDVENRRLVGQYGMTQDQIIKTMKEQIKVADELAAAMGDTYTGGGAGGGSKLTDSLMNRFDLVDQRLTMEATKYQDVIDLQQRQNELDQRAIAQNNRALDQLSKQEDAINKSYDTRLKALDEVGKANDRIKQQEQSRIDLATALASGNISAAASQAADIANANAAYQIEDARAALELNREESLKNLKVEINGQLLTRQQIQEQIDAIEERIYQRNQIIQTQQDALYNLERQRLANSREREKVETRLYLLEQRKAIVELQRKSVFSKLSTEDRTNLASFKQGYNEMVAFFNSTYGENLQTVMYGGKIKKYAFGGVTYKGSNEPPPALKMAFGSIVPGLGNVDRVPALLTPGEFVVRKSVAQANMPLLDALNNGMLSAPSYSVPRSDFGVSQSTVSQNTGIVYNDTYSINVNVAGTNASPDDIANVVITKLSQVNRGNLRGIRY